MHRLVVVTVEKYHKAKSEKHVIISTYISEFFLRVLWVYILEPGTGGSPVLTHTKSARLRHLVNLWVYILV